MTTQNISSKTSFEAIILAAGLGTRMKSDLPKVLHTVAGVSMVELLITELDSVMRDMKGASFNIVVGYQRELVMSRIQALVDSGVIKTPVAFTVQEEQKGTGHAVKLALQIANSAQVGVFNGDLPLFSAEAFKQFFEEHMRAKSVASLASTVLVDPAQYGRVVRAGKKFKKVVEYKDANPAQRRIQEINGGVYLFDRAFLNVAIEKIGNKNKAGEYYLPRVFELAGSKKTLAHCFEDQTVLLGVNNLAELAVAEKTLYRRIANRHMVAGVRVYDPDTTYIGPFVTIGTGSSVGQGTIIEGRSQIAEKVTIGPNCVLRDMRIAAGANIKHATYAEKSEIGRGTNVGPMAHLRPGSVLGEDVKIGNFVEIKEASIGNKTAVSHLSYVGDAKVGARVNIGCGFVTCNYDGTVRDGQRKHRSIIGDDVFIGSDSQVVAPIEIASGTFIASGSTVTETVKEADSLVVARTRQVTKPGYARKYKRGTK